MKITDHARRVLREKIELHTGVRVGGLAMDDIAMSLEGAAQYSAALSPPPVDGVEAGVEVRVADRAEGVDPLALHHALLACGVEPVKASRMITNALDRGYLEIGRRFWMKATARIPLPSVPVVSGVVGEAGE